MSWGLVGVLSGRAVFWLAVAAGAVVLAGCGVAVMVRSWPDLDRLTDLEDEWEQLIGVTRRTDRAM
ncbi:MAG TPA: hypothetical protein VGJ13_19885 [Pseudonocardiaceae bacterium]